jgi:MFS transporter, ENTS family, enterobactin (siderophore) exporter
MTLLVGQGISAIGDAVSFTALPLLVLALTGSGLAMGIVGVLQSIPDLVFGMVAGVLADRSDRRRMMLLADLGRAILTALIPVSVLIGAPTIVVVFLIAAPMSVLRSIFLAAYTASLPSLVGRAQLGRANSIFEAIYSFGYIIGPGIAGFLVATIGAAETIGLDAASYVASAVALFLIRRPLTVRREHPPLDLVAEIREGVAYVAGHRTLRDAIAFWGLVSVVSAGLVPALAFFIIRERGLDASALGLILSGYGLGTFIGAVITSRLRLRRAGWLMLGGNLARGAGLVAIFASGTLPAMTGVALLAGVVDSVVLITYITLRAAASPDELLGRVGSTARTISLGLQPLGFVGAGLLIDAIGGGVTLATIGLALVAASGLFVLSAPFRNASAGAR